MCKCGPVVQEFQAFLLLWWLFGGVFLDARFSGSTKRKRKRVSALTLKVLFISHTLAHVGFWLDWCLSELYKSCESGILAKLWLWVIDASGVASAGLDLDPFFSWDCQISGALPMYLWFYKSWFIYFSRKEWVIDLYRCRRPSKFSSKEYLSHYSEC